MPMAYWMLHGGVGQAWTVTSTLQVDFGPRYISEQHLLLVPGRLILGPGTMPGTTRLEAWDVCRTIISPLRSQRHAAAAKLSAPPGNFRPCPPRRRLVALAADSNTMMRQVRVCQCFVHVRAWMGRRSAYTA